MSDKKNPVITMRESEFRARMKSAATHANSIAIAVMLVAAHDEFGLGRQRLERLLDRSNNLTDSLNKGLISFDELVDVVDEAGIIGAFEYVRSREAKGYLDPAKK